MSGFLLATVTSERVGFLLMAGDELLAPDDSARDCVFLSAPSRAELVEHPFNRFFIEYRATEFECSLSRIGDEWRATVPIQDRLTVCLCCKTGETGQWHIECEGEEHLVGKCRLLGDE